MKLNLCISKSALLAASLTILISASRAQVATNLATVYRVVDLGVLPGGLDDSYAIGLNDFGQVVGQSSSSGNPTGAYAGFVWDSTNGMRDVGLITGNATWLAGINAQGVAVGDSGDSYAGWFEACKWDATNGIQGLGFGAIAGYPYYDALAINDSGAMTYVNWNFSGPPSKVYFLSGTNATWIGELYPGAYTFANALNNKNEAVGQSQPSSLVFSQAFFWTTNQGMVGLGFLAGYSNSAANGINDSSQAVGTSWNSDGTQTAFIWSSDRGMTALGSSEIGGSNSYAGAISAGGIAVGFTQVDDIRTAVAWAPGQDAVNLNTLVTNMDGWSNISQVRGINSSGVMVGDGVRTNGVRHAFILYPAATPVTLSIKFFPGIIISNATIGSNYLVQASSDLASGTWTTLTNIVVTSQPYIFIDLRTNVVGQQYYRVQQQ